MTGRPTLSVRVAEADFLTPDVRRIRLVSTSGGPLPLFSGGAHIVLHLPTPQGIVRNPYSLTSCPTDGAAYEICVQKSPTSRGGSAFVHDRLKVGDALDISWPVNLFAMDRRARKHLFVAGGIGITPFLAMMQQLAKEGGAFELHYAMRALRRAPRARRWRSFMAARVRTYVSSHGSRISLPELLEGQPLGTHLYVCGPTRLIDDVLLQAREAGWPTRTCTASVSPPRLPAGPSCWNSPQRPAHRGGLPPERAGGHRGGGAGLPPISAGAAPAASANRRRRLRRRAGAPRTISSPRRSGRRAANS